MEMILVMFILIVTFQLSATHSADTTDIKYYLKENTIFAKKTPP